MELQRNLDKTSPTMNGMQGNYVGVKHNCVRNVCQANARIHSSPHLLHLY
jgi:hypothetical protein